ncbi:MAG: 50S ribosomal protein L20 [Rickettsiales bacterium]|jgi:large subunit ribosomal protein L20|nr:50S ribosomal protein L20 [Rickettsiales bacterium]
MARVKRGVTAKKRHKKVLKLAKGFRGRAKSCYRIALTRLERSFQYAYRDRRNKKRDLRGIWIQRINAAARLHGLKYSILIDLLKKANINLDRKQLAEMAATSPDSFKTLVDTVKN